MQVVCEKMVIFRSISRFISKMIQGRVIVTVELLSDLLNGAISNDLE